MHDAVIVSTARTPIGKAYRGAFNDTQAQALAAHAITHAVERAGIASEEIVDVVLGSALQQGSTHINVARQAAIGAGLPTSVPGMTVDRQCSSGLMALSIISGQVRDGEIAIGVAGGVESVSLVQTPKMNIDRLVDPWIEAQRPDIYMTMLETAEIVAARYGITRDAQDEYAVESHRRTAAAQAEGRFDAEIVPMASIMKVKDRETGDVSDRAVTLEADEGVRPQTNVEGLQALQPVFSDGQQISEGRFITAGNASQLSDGASALVVMRGAEAERRGLEPLGMLRGVAVAGCDPDEMGIGPVFAVPKLLEAHGLSVDDIDLWELNEAFASQVLYCRDRLGIDPDRFNVSGGAIAVGTLWHDGRKAAGHLLTRSPTRRQLGSFDGIGGGMGAAGLSRYTDGLAAGILRQMRSPGEVPMPRNLLLAISVILVGIIAFDLMGILVRMLGASYPVMQMAALRNLFGVIPSLLLLWHARQLVSLPRLNHPRFHLINLVRATSVVMAQFCFYTALTKIEFATAAALGFSGPIFITALSVPLLGHHIGTWRWGAVFVGFLGVVTILSPFNDGFSGYMVLPVMAAFCYAVSSILVRFYPPEIPSAAIQFGHQIATCLLASLALFLFVDPEPISSLADAGLFVIMGALGGIGVLSLAISYRLADPSSVSPFEYFGIPISFALGWIFFAEAPFGDLFPGIVFIVGAGIIIMMRERRRTKSGNQV